MAMAVANRPEDDEPLQRKLWLAIARHLVQTACDPDGGDRAVRLTHAARAQRLVRAAQLLHSAWTGLARNCHWLARLHAHSPAHVCTACVLGQPGCASAGAASSWPAALLAAPLALVQRPERALCRRRALPRSRTCSGTRGAW